MWNDSHSKVFENIKQKISPFSKLTTFNPSKETVIECDASQFGLGSCLTQNRKPIVFPSKGLISAESQYSQIEKSY